MPATQRSAPLPEDVDPSYRDVRQRSEALCAPLETDDYQVQSVIDASPPKWHLAHITWFFETFLLKPFLRGYEPLDERYERIYNSSTTPSDPSTRARSGTRCRARRCRRSTNTAPTSTVTWTASWRLVRLSTAPKSTGA
jgi:hypothetical protein